MGPSPRCGSLEGHGIFRFCRMEKNTNAEIVHEMTRLFDKMAVESFVPVMTGDSETIDAEAALINLKTINARYDKHEALTHVQALMRKYNIQIDELLEQIKY
jgi:hypothetical protein